MAKAVWNGATLAESDDIALVEGNAYFPVDSLNKDLFSESTGTDRTYCHWKGFADYYDIRVGGKVFEGGAWYYAEPYEEAAVIKDRVAFYGEVEVSGAPEGRGLVESVPSPRGNRSGWEALCWLIRHSDKNELSADEITANTDIPADEIAKAWQVFDVQRYAKRYKWSLEGSSADLKLVRSA